MRKVFSALFLSAWYGAFFVRKPGKRVRKNGVIFGTKKVRKNGVKFGPKRSAKTAFLFCPPSCYSQKNTTTCYGRKKHDYISYIHSFIQVKHLAYFAVRFRTRIFPMARQSKSVWCTPSSPWPARESQGCTPSPSPWPDRASQWFSPPFPRPDRASQWFSPSPSPRPGRASQWCTPSSPSSWLARASQGCTPSPSPWPDRASWWCTPSSPSLWPGRASHWLSSKTIFLLWLIIFWLLVEYSFAKQLFIHSIPTKPTILNKNKKIKKHRIIF